MSLEKVEVTKEVLLAMLSHAHSTESEEVMGLLLGDIRDDPPSGGGAVCRVSLAFPQIRTDRRKDRVETSPEQVARCSAHAERLTRETGLRTRVVGWYHSHPHITVLPSHVDVRTQAMYQLLDSGFVGLIVSTFNRDAASQGCTVQLTAFQSLPDGVAPGSGGGGGGGVGSGPMVRKEVRVEVVPAVTSLEMSFSDLMVVQRILLLEETEVYKKAIAQATSTAAAAAGGTAGSAGATIAVPSLELTEVHHAGVYQAHMVCLVETALRPTMAAMAAMVAQQRTQEQQLRQQVEALERMAAAAGAATATGL